jgi:hypothetical protein
MIQKKVPWSKNDFHKHKKFIETHEIHRNIKKLSKCRKILVTKEMVKHIKFISSPEIKTKLNLNSEIS